MWKQVANVLPLVGVIAVVLLFRYISRPSAEPLINHTEAALESVVARVQFATMDQTLFEQMHLERARVLPMLIRRLDADESTLSAMARDAVERLPANVRSNAPPARQPVEMRRAAAWALLGLMERTPPSEREVQALWPALEGALRDKDQLVRSTATAVVQYFTNDFERIVLIAERAAKDSSHFVRESAARTLGSVAQSEARARALLEALTNDVHAIVRDRAEVELRFIHGVERRNAIDRKLSSGGSGVFE